MHIFGRSARDRSHGRAISRAFPNELALQKHRCPHRAPSRAADIRACYVYYAYGYSAAYERNTWVSDVSQKGNNDFYLPCCVRATNTALTTTILPSSIPSTFHNMSVRQRLIPCMMHVSHTRRRSTYPTLHPLLAAWGKPLGGRYERRGWKRLRGNVGRLRCGRCLLSGAFSLVTVASACIALGRPPRVCAREEWTEGARKRASHLSDIRAERARGTAH